MFTAISSLANNVRNPWPVIRTSNIENANQANGYPDKYVWLLDDRFDFDDDFPLAWLPPDEYETHIHLFPLIKRPSNKKIRNIAALVPTRRADRRWPLQQEIPACIKTPVHDIFLISDSTPKSREQFATLSQGKTNMYMLRDTDSSAELCKQVLRNISSSYAWLIDINTEFPDNIQTFVTAEEKQIYSYSFGNLYPIEYFFSLGEKQFNTIACQFD